MTRLRHPILLTLVLAAPLSALSGQGPGSPVALVATTRDLNGFPLNPTWAAGAGPVDIDRRCGFFAGPGQPGYRSLVVRNPECLVGADVLRMNEARDPKGGGLFCRQGNDDGLIQGHVHWYPVTMTGRSTWKSYAEDGDYTLLFEGDGPVAQTTGNVELGGIELEFNSTETMLRLRQDEGRWWTKLHRAAIESKAAARALLTATPTIVTGLFGIDGVPGYPIELHPVFAIAWLVESDSATTSGDRHDRWAYFVRNLGDEGNCSHGQVALHASETPRPFRFRLPWVPSAQEVRTRFGPGESWVSTTHHAVTGPHLLKEVGRGLSIGFELPSAGRDEPDAFAIGELLLTWTGAAKPIVAGPEKQIPTKIDVEVARPEQLMARRSQAEPARVSRMLRHHQRSSAPEREVAPPHDPDFSPRTLMSDPPEPAEAVEVWPDERDIRTCAEIGSWLVPLCANRHRIIGSVGYVLGNQGADRRIGSIRLGLIEYGPGRWPFKVPFLGDGAILRLMAGIDRVSRTAAGGGVNRSSVVYLGPTVAAPIQNLGMRLPFSIQPTVGPALLHDRGLGRGAGAALLGGVGLRFASSQPLAGTFDLQCLWLKKGPDLCNLTFGLATVWIW